MSGNVDEHLEKAEQALGKMEAYRSDSEFREDWEAKHIRLEQAVVEALEAIYHQNQAILTLLRSARTET